MHAITSEQHRLDAGKLRSALATYREAEDLINIGAYVEGSNSDIDSARRQIGCLRAFLRQTPHERSDFRETQDQLSGATGGA
jgi:flagellum-specific ATP synthase